MLKVAIVGLPNVGKSTLFNALLKKQVAHAANYPFATIEPNIGVIEVPDARLPKLAKIVNTDSIIPAAIEFYDIAGLVRGASEGEGLGNQFLSHIRETHLICHVVRLFEDSKITHVDSDPEPANDIDTIETELILADIAILSNQKEPKGNTTKAEIFAWDTILFVLDKLNNRTAARNLDLSDDQKAVLKQFNLLSLKPVLYFFNISESQLKQGPQMETQIINILKKTGEADKDYLFFCAELEKDLSQIDVADQAEYLKEYGIAEAGLNHLVKKAYAKLDLISFLTAGEKEVRAWTVTRGTLAPQAAGTIHTDFEKNFIKAEVLPYDDFVSLGGWQGAREQGKALLGGKDYEIKDGDVIDFKVGV